MAMIVVQYKRRETMGHTGKDGGPERAGGCRRSGGTVTRRRETKSTEKGIKSTS